MLLRLPLQLSVMRVANVVEILMLFVPLVSLVFLRRGLVLPIRLLWLEFVPLPLLLPSLANLELSLPSTLLVLEHVFRANSALSLKKVESATVARLGHTVPVRQVSMLLLRPL